MFHHQARNEDAPLCLCCSSALNPLTDTFQSFEVTQSARLYGDSAATGLLAFFDGE